MSVVCGDVEDRNTHASVKKPTPATMQTRRWNILKIDVRFVKGRREDVETHENFALSTSARAARRFSSRVKAAALAPLPMSLEVEALSTA